MKVKVCPICNGAKHVCVDGTWRRCECIKAGVRKMRFAQAGVPELHYEDELATLQTNSWLPTTRIFTTKPRNIWVRSIPSSRKRIATVAYVLRTALDMDYMARRFTVQQLIDARFDPTLKSVVYPQIKSAQLLVMEVDLKTSHKFLASTLLDVYSQRLIPGATTVWFSGDDIPASTGRYGPEVCGLFGSDRFIRRGVIARRN